MSRMAPASEVPPAVVASVAELVGGIPGPGRPGPRSRLLGIVRRQTRPERIRGMAAAAVLLAVLLGLIAAAISGSVAGGLRLIGQQSEPEVLATTDLYYRLNDMDAQVANVLLVGGQRGLDIDRQQAQAIYEQDRVQADQDLQRAAVVAGRCRPPSSRCAPSWMGSAVTRRWRARPCTSTARAPAPVGPVGRRLPRSPSTGRRPTCCRAASCRPRAASPIRTRPPWTPLPGETIRCPVRRLVGGAVRRDAARRPGGLQIYFAVRYRRIFNPGWPWPRSSP